MVYVVFEATESLTSHFDTYFSIFVTNTTYFSSLKRKQNLGKIIDSVVEFGTISVGCCGGQALCSKSILKVVSQMAKPREHIHAPFLTQMTVLVGNLGFQSMTNHYGGPCSCNMPKTSGNCFEF